MQRIALIQKIKEYTRLLAATHRIAEKQRYYLMVKYANVVKFILTEKYKAKLTTKSNLYKRVDRQKTKI